VGHNVDKSELYSVVEDEGEAYIVALLKYLESDMFVFSATSTGDSRIAQHREFTY